MSLILDVLNRSRQDSQSVPGLATEHFSETAATGVSPLQWVLVLALALAVGLIVWLLLDRHPQDTPAASVIEPQQTSQGADREQSVTAMRPGQSVTPVPAERTPRPSVVKKEPSRSTTISQGAEQPGAAPNASPGSVASHGNTGGAAAQVAPASIEPARAQRRPVPQEVLALYQQPASAAPTDDPAPAAKAQASAQPASPAAAQPAAPDTDEMALDVEALVAAAEAELENARLTEHEVPFMASLSQQTKDEIPTILYTRHDYSGTPGQSTVYLNGATLREGGNASGMRVLEILPDSVVLEYRGTRFRLRALNSWVNL